MATLIQLDPTSDAAVRALVEGGRYTSPDAVIRAGLRLLQQREARLAELDAAIEQSIAEADAGQLIPIEDVRAELIDRYKNWPPKAQ